MAIWRKKVEKSWEKMKKRKVDKNLGEKTLRKSCEKVRKKVEKS